MRTPHTACRPGKKVLVKMKDGTKFVAKFKDRNSHYVVFMDHPRVIRGDIAGFSFYKANLQY